MTMNFSAPMNISTLNPHYIQFQNGPSSSPQRRASVLVYVLTSGSILPQSEPTSILFALSYGDIQALTALGFLAPGAQVFISIGSGFIVDIHNHAVVAIPPSLPLRASFIEPKMTITSSTVAAFIQSSSTASSSSGIIAALVVSVVVPCVVVIVVLIIWRRRLRKTEFVLHNLADNETKASTLEWDETQDALPEDFFQKDATQLRADVFIVKEIMHSLNIDSSPVIQTLTEPEGFLAKSHSLSTASEKDESPKFASAVDVVQRSPPKEQIDILYVQVAAILAKHNLQDAQESNNQQQLEDTVKPMDAKMSKSENIKPFPPTYDDDFVAITSATNQDPKIVSKKLDDENVSSDSQLLPAIASAMEIEDDVSYA